MKKLNSIIKKLCLNVVSFSILSAIFLLTIPDFSIAYEKEINNLSMTMAEKIASSGKKTIAVVDFTDLQGRITELGRFVAEEFSTALVDAGKGFEVVDRIHLRSILQEHKLSATGLIDPTTARKLGKIAGVDAIVTGTITPFGERVRVSVKVLTTDTAKIICASRGNIPKTKAIEELLAKGIEIATPWATGAVTTPPIQQIQQAKLRKGAGYIWEDGVLRVTVESLRKAGKEVRMRILYENISDEPIKVTANTYRDAHLLDENGERWDIRSDTAGLYNARNTLPGNKIRSKMIFATKGSASGSIFDLFLQSYGGGYKYSLTIQNIEVH